MMKRFMIVGEPMDLHADYVAWALRQAGHDVGLVNALHGGCPSSTSLYIDESTDKFNSADWNGVEAAWTRRLPVPLVALQNYSENEGFVLREEHRFSRWLIELQYDISPIRWVNAPACTVPAENKFIQLRNARLQGLRVPRTLVTAEPHRFRAFMEGEKQVVAKPLCSYMWEYSSGTALSAFATILDSERASQLADEDIARCVTMYQEVIEKSCDVRAVILGEDIFAYQVQQQREQHFDYRVGFLQENQLKYLPLPVPAAVKEKILAFMNAMKVNFASADFVLTPGGDWVFLDLNPNGQWLFIEKSSPEERIGQKFCSFFVHGKVDARTETQFASLSDYCVSEQGRSFGEAYRQHQLSTQSFSTHVWKESKA